MAAIEAEAQVRVAEAARDGTIGAAEAAADAAVKIARIRWLLAPTLAAICAIALMAAAALLHVSVPAP